MYNKGFTAILLVLIIALATGISYSGSKARVPKTGQTASYGAGSDGALNKGVAWPSPRFTDNADGTVTDNLTGLIWLKNASCFSSQAWAVAVSSANTLANGSCGLTDNSVAGDWRLPNVNEIESLIDYSHVAPALPVGNPFTGVPNFANYWTSTTYSGSTTVAWWVGTYGGFMGNNTKGTSNYVWPVRGGQ
jgi:hypothetical protein